MTKPVAAAFILLFLSLLLLPCTAFAQNSSADPDLPKYAKAQELDGVLSSIGSDSLGNLLLFWAETFKTLYPKVDIEIQSTGSSTAPPALALGSAAIGPMSRLMNEVEFREFETQHGYKPTPFTVAIDALAVFVHPQNPIEGLSLQQLDAIFSARHSCGAPAPIRSWKQLGLEGEWAARDIVPYGRNSKSGTYQYFKIHALCDGDFFPAVQEQPGSASVVRAVSQAEAGIGYSALGYASNAVRVLPLSRNSGLEFVEASRENAINGSYPLARLLYVYVNHDPAQNWDPVVREFIRMVFSQQGQEQVSRAGFAPLPAKVALRELQKLTEPAAQP